MLKNIKGKKNPRLGGEIDSLQELLGPLSELSGSWAGKGFNVVALPDKDNPNHFVLLQNPYIETLVFTPMQSPVPNRSKGPTQHIGALLYEQKVLDAEDFSTMHEENGMFLNRVGNAPEDSMARQASIPHGNVALSLGGWFKVEQPQFDILNSAPDGQPADAMLGYSDPFPTNVQEKLQEAISGQKIIETTVIQFDSTKGGGVLSIPFINANAPTPDFKSTFWIEKVQNDDGSTFMQLQYAQVTTIKFTKKDGSNELISWPHIDVATLRKG